MGGSAQGRSAYSDRAGHGYFGQARAAAHRRSGPCEGGAKAMTLTSSSRLWGRLAACGGMSSRLFSLRFLCVLCVSALNPISTAFAQPGQLLGPAAQSKMQDANLKPALPGALQGVGIDQRLDQQVSLDLMFKDEAGRDVPLSWFFKRGKPVILAPVYYRCPMLCTQILNGLASSLKAVSLDPGKDFEIVAVSFDPKDTPETAGSKKQMYLRRYGRQGTANGWHLLTGDQANITALMDTIG